MPTHIPVQLLPEPGALESPRLEDGKVYTRRVRGYYQRLRRLIAAPLLALFFVLPWLTIDERPAILLDISAQKFQVLWGTFWPQDGLLLVWILTIAALGLFTLTVIAGRVWCGFGCPQTVWTQMFIWLEDKCEGDRLQRIKLDAQPWGRSKILRKGLKHTLWLALAGITGFTFIACFYGARDLLADILHWRVGGEALFWLLFFSAATYVNAGWMREQVCKIMCPYARFQSVMFDQHTKLVSYDAARGDSLVDASSNKPLNKRLMDPLVKALRVRLPRSMKTDHRAEGLGDCIDCHWCVQVCPVNIDIRDGLQADCINCGLCIDACDSVMARMNYDSGLIRFGTQAELAGEPSIAWVSSPRLWGYSLLLAVTVALFMLQLHVRTPLEVSVLRDRGVHLYRQKADHIENVYRLRLANMGRDTQRYQVSVLPPYTLKGHSLLVLEEGEFLTVPVSVSLKNSQIKNSQQPLVFRVQSLSEPSDVVEKTTTFIAPSFNPQGPIDPVSY